MMKAMILSAGLGTRLKPITDRIPKALVEISGKPLIEHVIGKLHRDGIDDFVVNVHHHADVLKEYLLSTDLGVKIAISDESAVLLDTGGGILGAEELLRGGAPSRFLVHNVDILSNFDLNRLLAASKGISTLLVSERKTNRYLLFDSDMRLCGWTNIATGEVRSPYPQINAASCKKLAFSGIHCLSTDIFDAMRDCAFSGSFPIMDFYIDHCDRYPIYGHKQDDLVLVDVGKMDSLAQASEALSGSLAGIFLN